MSYENIILGFANLALHSIYSIFPKIYCVAGSRMFYCKAPIHFKIRKRKIIGFIEGNIGYGTKNILSSKDENNHQLQIKYSTFSLTLNINLSF